MELSRGAAGGIGATILALGGGNLLQALTEFAGTQEANRHIETMAELKLGCDNDLGKLAESYGELVGMMDNHFRSEHPDRVFQGAGRDEYPLQPLEEE